MDRDVFESFVMMDAVTCPEFLIEHLIERLYVRPGLKITVRGDCSHCFEMLLETLSELIESAKIHLTDICNVAVPTDRKPAKRGTFGNSTRSP